MVESSFIGLVVFILVAILCGIVAGAWVYTLRSRKELIDSVNYLMDRLIVAESDLQRMRDNQEVLNEHLKRRGLLDDDDLTALRREIIDIPQQLEAEKNELLKEAIDADKKDRLVKNIPDTLH